MSYNKRLKWKDHWVKRPRTYTEAVNRDGSKTFTPAPGEVLQQGTPLSASNLNRIEEGIQHISVAFDYFTTLFQATVRHQVTSVNGQTGDVTLKKENIGLGNVPNVATEDQTPAFTQGTSRSNIASGDTLSTMLGKISRWFADLKNVAFTGRYSDLTGTPTIPEASTATPKAPGAAAAGSATAWARGDHVHPAQTSVTGSSGSCTGNAATATTADKVANALTFTGAVKDSYDGSANKTVNIPEEVSVKGNAESAYRTGKVNLTAENIGTYDKAKIDSLLSSLTSGGSYHGNIDDLKGGNKIYWCNVTSAWTPPTSGTLPPNMSYFWLAVLSQAGSDCIQIAFAASEVKFFCVRTWINNRWYDWNRYTALQDGKVQTENLADGAVTSAKINNGAVISEKIGNKAVTSEKLDELYVSSSDSFGSFLMDTTKKFNSLRSGFFRWTTALTDGNKPYPSGVGLCILQNDDSAVQLAVPTTTGSPHLVLRRKKSGTWEAWQAVPLPGENIVLSDIHYGTKLPAAGEKGRLFFLKV